MSLTVTDTMLMPTYASRFTCIGGDCEDTCCAGWGVTLDEETYHRYRSCSDPLLAPKLQEHVQKYKHSKSSKDFGHIKLRDDACRSCGLLSDKKLCLIQERLGEEALSDTCASYPRTIFRFGELHQMTLTLSCPEAARLALLAEDAFGFVGKEQTASLAFIAPVDPKFGLTQTVMEDTQALLLQVLRSQDVPLADRLRVIGRFCERLTDSIERRQPAAVGPLLQELARDLESGAAMAPFAGMTEALDVQAHVATSLSLLGAESFQSPHVQRILALARDGLGFEGKHLPPGEVLVAAYARGSERLKRAMEPVPWLLEHFVLNEALRTLFPWGLENPKRQFATLVIRFATIRLILVGRAARQEAPLTPLELAETVQAACRRYVHDAHYARNLNQVLSGARWEDLNLLFSLL
ncbi:MAG: flagellin lysine-N-methylase [Holophagaceae bacterium]|uniref:Flagellin lysine-N-methylase n=1 Tax=Candidatus Geothrix odensensis TaxID=2954440 RepID=A0A936F492_9BACT|nr:flagellin lysine-N-methylase [Candidatus Geothrix odensensis]